MKEFIIKIRENGEWNEIADPMNTGGFSSYDDAINYINDEILSGNWGSEFEDINPDYIDAFEV